MIRTRFAPSPTGFIHVGGVYSILLDYAWAKKNKGKFILRIEDTDLKRTVKGAEEAIYETLEWLGLKPDEGPYRQSERLNLYQEYAHQLIKKDKAYYCFCSEERLKQVRQEQQKANQPPRYDRKCCDLPKKETKARIKKGEKHVIRMRIPEDEKVIVPDLIRGPVEFDSNLLDDQVILKSDGYPTYHLAVVVDDHLMKITHVVRGEDWLPSAPKHVLLYQYFGWPLPKFVHTPLLRNPDKSKLSKRHGHVSVFWYREQGYLPEALLNFLALLGWSHPEGKEVFSLAEFIKYFRFEDLSPVGPVFNLRKLDWLNGVYIRQKSQKDLVRLLKPFAPKVLTPTLINQTVPLVQERITKLSDYPDLVGFLIKEIKYSAKLLIPKGKTKEEIRNILTKVFSSLSQLKEKDWNVKNLQKICQELTQSLDCQKRDLFMAVRVAVTGKTVTPPLFESMALLGRTKTLARLQKALQKLNK